MMAGWGAHIVGQTLGHEAPLMRQLGIHFGSLNIVSNFAEGNAEWIGEDPGPWPTSIAPARCPWAMRSSTRCLARIASGIGDCRCADFRLPGLRAFPVDGRMMNLPPELQSALLGQTSGSSAAGGSDDTLANSVIAQLLLVAGTVSGPDDTIQLYIDSAGGSFGAALSVYDVIQSLGARVSTTCVGSVGGASVVVLAGGAAGVRYALPHARIHLTDEPIDLPAGSPRIWPVTPARLRVCAPAGKKRCRADRPLGDPPRVAT